MIGGHFERFGDGAFCLGFRDLLFREDTGHLLAAALISGRRCRIAEIQVANPQAHPTSKWAHLFRNAKPLYQAIVGVLSSALLIRLVRRQLMAWIGWAAHVRPRLKSASVTSSPSFAATAGSPILAASLEAIASAAVLSGSAAMWA